MRSSLARASHRACQINAFSCPSLDWWSSENYYVKKAWEFELDVLGQGLDPFVGERLS